MRAKKRLCYHRDTCEIFEGGGGGREALGDQRRAGESWGGGRPGMRPLHTGEG